MTTLHQEALQQRADDAVLARRNLGGHRRGDRGLLAVILAAVVVADIGYNPFRLPSVAQQPQRSGRIEDALTDMRARLVALHGIDGVAELDERAAAAQAR